MHLIYELRSKFIENIFKNMLQMSDFRHGNKFLNLCMLFSVWTGLWGYPYELLKRVSHIIRCHETSQGFPKSMLLIGCDSCKSPFWNAHIWTCWTFFDIFKIIVLCNCVSINCDALRHLEHNIHWLCMIQHTFNKKNYYRKTHQSMAFLTASVVLLFSLNL